MLFNRISSVFLLFSLFVFFSFSVLAQSILDQINDNTGFPNITSDLLLEFPLDHGAHNEFRIEWWYVTANLKDDDKNTIGLQWTLFRVALEPKSNKDGWNKSQFWMGHAAITDSQSHLFQEKIARGGIFQAGVSTEPFKAWIDDWKMEGNTWSDLHLSAGGERFKYYINLESNGPIILHGINGFSQKSFSGQASAYYSQPFFEASGWIEKNGERYNVSGSAWADHEWSSQVLSKTQEGWDWFSLNFESKEKLMLFRVREHNKNDFYYGSWIQPSGKIERIQQNEIHLKSKKMDLENTTYNTTWDLEIKKLGVDITINAINDRSHMETIFPYWEGPISFTGTHKGNGYLEMTGASNP